MWLYTALCFPRVVSLCCSREASKEEAFHIGKEIVEAVTADNPKPVKLKFEKVLL